MPRREAGANGTVSLAEAAKGDNQLRSQASPHSLPSGERKPNDARTLLLRSPGRILKGPGERYLPLNSGGRFCMKALAPSWKSSLR